MPSEQSVLFFAKTRRLNMFSYLALSFMFNSTFTSGNCGCGMWFIFLIAKFIKTLPEKSLALSFICILQKLQINNLNTNVYILQHAIIYKIMKQKKIGYRKYKTWLNFF